MIKMGRARRGLCFSAAVYRESPRAAQERAASRMKTFYLIRHGETAHNASGLTMGQMDIPLNERGQAQARQTAEWLRRYPITRIVSSDLSRALATAQPLAAALGVTVEPEPRLRELSFGIFEGRSIAQCEVEQPDIVARWRGGAFDFAPPGGETRRSLMERTRSLLDDLLAAPENHVALFTHGGTLNALHTHFVEDEQAAPREHIHRVFRFHNAAVSMVAHAGDQWRFLVVNSTFHLDEEPRALLH
jgi:probable phosphoglycerate mutase